MNDVMDYTCGGMHPDPRKLSELFCRRCGLWKDGVRLGDATSEELLKLIKKIVSEP